ncbi:MAG: gliding motility protein GldM [Bacteroidales bacterium]|nr:gliding motility protein GldM [Bacteroidales bacterium]MCF8389211.1 gliding motility protein GldM [Bacteroidales bacterium]
MGHGKETPRQKMIGMMYLVLTALLALNVAKSVLDAFTLVDAGLTKTTANFNEKNSSYYSDFETAYELNKTKVESWKNKADEVREKAEALVELLQEYKRKIVIISEGEDSEAIHDGEVDLALVNGKDNTSIGGQVMILEKGGEDVKENIDAFRKFTLDLIDNKETYASIYAAIESTLDTSDPKNSDEHGGGHGGELITWESEHFEHLPLASVITILSKMQIDVRFAEAEILSYLLSQIDAGSFKFNKIEAVVLAGSDYVFKGQDYKAKVFLAAYDSTKAPEIMLTSGEKLNIEDGKGIYVGPTSSIGTKNWGGTIVLEGDGPPIVRNFEASYQVAEASAVVSPTKMNVFYRGVKNPVAISVAGVSKASIKAEITKGSIKLGSDGDWVVSPAPGAEGEVVKIRVYADVDGQNKFMGEVPFRVKNVPNPVAKIGGKSQGGITLTQLSKATGVEAEMEDFDFDLEFQITEFTVSAVASGGFTKMEKSTSGNFTEAQKDIIRGLSNGKNFTVTEVKAIGPGGDVRVLNSIVLKIL